MIKTKCQHDGGSRFHWFVECQRSSHFLWWRSMYTTRGMLISSAQTKDRFQSLLPKVNGDWPKRIIPPLNVIYSHGKSLDSYILFRPNPLCEMWLRFIWSVPMMHSCTHNFWDSHRRLRSKCGQHYMTKGTWDQPWPHVPFQTPGSRLAVLSTESAHYYSFTPTLQPAVT